MKYKLSNFHYTLPEKLIANKPPLERDGARMMVVDRKTGDIIYNYQARFYNS